MNTRSKYVLCYVKINNILYTVNIDAVMSSYDKSFPTMSFTVPFLIKCTKEENLKVHKVISVEACSADR